MVVASRPIKGYVALALSKDTVSCGHADAVRVRRICRHRMSSRRVLAATRVRRGCTHPRARRFLETATNIIPSPYGERALFSILSMIGQREAWPIRGAVQSRCAPPIVGIPLAVRAWDIVDCISGTKLSSQRECYTRRHQIQHYEQLMRTPTDCNNDTGPH